MTWSCFLMVECVHVRKMRVKVGFLRRSLLYGGVVDDSRYC
jgi:hypothetical protein